MRGHRFSWFNDGTESRFSDPPANTPCEHCGRPFAEVKDNIHFCLSAWSKHPNRVAFVSALQGVE
jgi:hypothetical protein